jgi:hypothetical protein
VEHNQEMSIFNYTLPSGAEFTVRGPAGASKEQADRVFYEQVAAGSLVGYTAGQTLTSAASKIVRFQLSRLERGTAGVENTPVLSIIQNLPTVQGIPDLVNVPLVNPVNTADVIEAKGADLGPTSIGPLDSFQVQKLLAQVSNIVDQAFDEITLEKGVGKYGFNAYALEQIGYLKPGTTASFLSVSSEDFVSVLSSPAVWTGQDSVTGLDVFLADEELQNQSQYQLMSISYQSLQAAGVITQPATAPATPVSGTVYTNSGLQTLSTLGLLGVNLGSLAGITSTSLANNAALRDLVSLPITNLKTLSSGAVNSLIQNRGIGALSSLNFNSLGNLASNQITGSIGALVNNASKFGTQATALWANSSNLPGLGSIAGLNTTNLSSLANLNLSPGSLTNLIPGSFSNLTSGLDQLGKASQYSVNFANPLNNFNDLGNLSSLGNLGNLTDLGGLSNLYSSASGQITGALSAASGQATAILGSLTGQLNSTLSSLTGQFNVSQLSNLFGGSGFSNLFGGLGNFGGLANLGGIGEVFGGGGDLVSGTVVAGGYNNTVNRGTVDAAFKRILGSDKIPVPDYDYPSSTNIQTRLDIQQAQNILISGGGFGGSISG